MRQVISKAKIQELRRNPIGDAQEIVLPRSEPRIWLESANAERVNGRGIEGHKLTIEVLITYSRGFEMSYERIKHKTNGCKGEEGARPMKRWKKTLRRKSWGWKTSLDCGCSQRLSKIEETRQKLRSSTGMRKATEDLTRLMAFFTLSCENL